MWSRQLEATQRPTSCMAPHSCDMQVHSGQMEEKGKRIGLSTVKTGSTGEDRVERDSFMGVVCPAT